MSSARASSVPVVARSHQASFTAFSTGATRSSNPRMNASISAGEDTGRSFFCGSAAGGAVAPAAEPDHDDQEDDAQSPELQKSSGLALSADGERGHEDEGQRRVPGGPEGEVGREEPDENVQDGQERGQVGDKGESAGGRRSRGPEPELAGRDEADGAALPRYRFGVEVVGLVPASLADLVASPAPDFVRTPTSSGFFSPREPAAEAFPKTRTAGLALLAAGGEFVLPVAEIQAGELVGGVGQVEGLVVHPPPVRVGEDGVGLLEERELLGAPARVVGVAFLRQPAVCGPDLFLRSLAGDAEHLVVVDLIRHRVRILTHGCARGPASERQLYLL